MIDPLEQALINALGATDSAGHLIRLISPPDLSPETIARTANEVIQRLSRDGIILGGTDPDHANRVQAKNILLTAHVLYEARTKITESNK